VSEKKYWWKDTEPNEDPHSFLEIMDEILAEHAETGRYYKHFIRHILNLVNAVEGPCGNCKHAHLLIDQYSGRIRCDVHFDALTHIQQREFLLKARRLLNKDYVVCKEQDPIEQININGESVPITVGPKVDSLEQ
jgi:hypothetical protein